MRLLRNFKKVHLADALLVALKKNEALDLELRAVDTEGKTPRKERLNKKRERVFLILFLLLFCIFF